MPFDSIGAELRFASAVALFGLKLKESKYLPKADWSFIENLANQSADKNNYLQNEFLQLIKKAEKIYSEKKRKNRD
jgi:Ca-activated chloride channel family protein